MGITKRGPNRYFIKARAKAFGEDRRRQEDFYGTKAQAEERYIEFLRELRGERLEAQAFGDFLESYKESRGGEIPRSERSIYLELERDLSAVEISQIGPALQQYAGLLRRLPSKVTGRKLSAAALNRRRAMVAAALNLAVELKRLPESPLNAAIWPKEEEIPRDRFLPELEVRRLLNVLEAQAPHLLPITRYALRVPCRKSELVRMGREDLDLFSEAIRVHNGTTKNEEGAWKPIPPELVAYFRSIPAECPYLFYRVVGGKYLPLGDFKKAWGRALKLAGIRNFHFHDTRHISATALVDNGTPERAVMDIAGWKTNMLSTYYGSSSKKALSLVKFSRGSGNEGATFGEGGEKLGDSGIERAVS